MEAGKPFDPWAVLAGIIDVQLVTLLLFRAQLDLKFSDVIERLELVNRLIDAQGGTETYVASRHVAANTLLAAVRHAEAIANRAASPPPGSPRPALEVILGGMAGGASSVSGVRGVDADAGAGDDGHSEQPGEDAAGR